MGRTDNTQTSSGGGERDSQVGEAGGRARWERKEGEPGGGAAQGLKCLRGAGFVMAHISKSVETSVQP